MKFVKMIAAAAAALALSGCLVSERPLLSAANAKATPLAPGRYEACGEDKDCKMMNVTRESALYTLDPDGDEHASMARFRPLGRGYLAQMWEDGDSAFYYFYAEKTKGGARLTMVTCPEISDGARKRLVKSKDLEISTDGSTCTAKTLKGAARAARDFVGRRTAESGWTVLTRKAE